MTFGTSYNFIGKMGEWELGVQQGVLWNKMIFCGVFFCVYRCEGVFLHGEKSNFAKHSITYHIL